MVPSTMRSEGTTSVSSMAAAVCCDDCTGRPSLAWYCNDGSVVCGTASRAQEIQASVLTMTACRLCPAAAARACWPLLVSLSLGFQSFVPRVAMFREEESESDSHSHIRNLWLLFYALYTVSPKRLRRPVRLPRTKRRRTCPAAASLCYCRQKSFRSSMQLLVSTKSVLRVSWPRVRIAETPPDPQRELLALCLLLFARAQPCWTRLGASHVRLDIMGSGSVNAGLRTCGKSHLVHRACAAAGYRIARCAACMHLLLLVG